MKKLFEIGHALPRARARISRCAKVATNVAGINRIRVACNVAPDVASNVAAKSIAKVRGAWRVKLNETSLEREALVRSMLSER